MDGEGHRFIIVKEFDDLEGGPLLFEEENIGDKHLTDPEHASPARICGIVGAIESLFNVGSVGHEDVLLLMFLLVSEGMLFFGGEIGFHVFYYGLHQQIISISGA